MIVPPYVPDMLEVRGNVAGEKYSVRIEFIRKVVLAHYGSVLLVCLMALAPVPAPPMEAVVPLLLASLLMLSLARQVRRFSQHEHLYSIGLSPVMFISLGFLTRDAVILGFPAWAPLAGLTCAVVYTLAAGRDFSFVWVYILAGIASSLAVAALILYGPLLGFPLGQALILNAGYLLYFVYDLACLQSRRRKHEIGGAVIDLYRDVLNFLTYSIRVVKHWRRYRIWAPK